MSAVSAHRACSSWCSGPPKQRTSRRWARRRSRCKNVGLRETWCWKSSATKLLLKRQWRYCTAAPKHCSETWANFQSSYWTNHSQSYHCLPRLFGILQGLWIRWQSGRYRNPRPVVLTPPKVFNCEFICQWTTVLWLEWLPVEHEHPGSIPGPFLSLQVTGGQETA